MYALLNIWNYLAHLVATIVFVFASPYSSASESLDLATYHHITFKKIPETIYAKANEGLSIKVAKSSSFLFKPFASPRIISEVFCEWRSTPVNPFLKVISNTTPELRKKKEGDDFPLRIALMLSGKAPMVPFFAASWIKAIETYSKLPSDQLLYLTAGSPFTGGTRWTNPYSSSIENLAFADSVSPEGWVRSSYKASMPHEVVGLWIMSDGDNTGADFSVELKTLSLK